MDLTETDIQEILKYLDSAGWDEIRLETANLKLVVRRSGASLLGTPQGASPDPTATAPASSPSPASPPPNQRESAPSALPAGDRPLGSASQPDQSQSAGDQRTGGSPAATQVPSETSAAARSQPPSSGSGAGAAEGRLPINAPMKGVFYRAPRPGAKPFVDLGSRVEEDTVVGIIEVMKLMHSIPAGTRGMIDEVCVADGQPVDEGQTLFWVRPLSGPKGR